MLLVLPLTEIPRAPEQIAKRKVIVYKSRVDPTIVKLTAEKMKSKLFVKFGFSKPRPEEIQVVSVDKHYEPYILLDAKYSVDYYKTKVYTLDVDNETEEVKILDETFEPEVVVDSAGVTRKVIKLETKECVSYIDKAYVVIDKTGREVPTDQVPSAPSEDHPQKILKEARKNVEKVKFSPRKGVELVKNRIVKRPADLDSIENELFKISEYAIIYSPVYEITFRHVKSGNERSIKIDGVTAKIVP